MSPRTPPDREALLSLVTCHLSPSEGEEMDHGLYSTYLGMRARQRTLDMIANNIANASTPGFKADRMLCRSVQAAEQESGIPFNLPGQQPELEPAGNGQALDRTLASTHGRN